MKIGIVGYGTVGSFLHRLFSLVTDQFAIYDKYRSEYRGPERQQLVNHCDLVFIAVPTPEGLGGETDISAVDDAVSWVTRPICIKSTVPPGTTRQLSTKYGKPLIMSPEYVGESPFHPYRESVREELVILGGDHSVANQFLNAYALALGPETKYFVTDSVTAELTKYMENCFFATKVGFVAQFYALAKQFGANFPQMREMWVADSRVGRSHSMVVGSPGFSGKCLPKDLAGIIVAAQPFGGAPFLEGVRDYNVLIRSGACEESVAPLSSTLNEPCGT
jgi:nucleotide sugar dehydrogenase